MNSNIFLIAVFCILAISLVANVLLSILVTKKNKVQEIEYECAICLADISDYEKKGSVCPECKCGITYTGSSKWWRVKK